MSFKDSNFISEEVATSIFYNTQTECSVSTVRTKAMAKSQGDKALVLFQYLNCAYCYLCNMILCWLLGIFGIKGSLC